MKVSDLPAFIKDAQAISFIIGAGASKTAGIPLASELVERIKSEKSHCLSDLSETEKTNYGKVMAALSRQERKELIEDCLDKAKLNWGHVALASIIQKSKIHRILSFNFDFLLEQAFSLLGVHLPVYDFGVAPTKNVTDLAEKAIFHLHGQSYGLKLLNSEQELFEHKEHLRPLIADSLRNHVTIVSGYSGSADGAFQVMLDEYNSNTRLFWLGYDKEPSRDIAPLFKKEYAVYIGGCDFDHSMIEIAQGLKCWPLPIIDNPPTHVLQQLDPLPDFPVGKENETAVLYETKLHLERLAKQWPEERSDAEIEASALMAGLAVTDLDKDLSHYSDAAKDKRAWRLIQEGNELSDQAKTLTGTAQAQGFKNASEKYAEAIRIKPDKHEAFNNWGAALSDQAKTLTGAAQAECFKNAGEKYAKAIRIKPDDHQTFYNWGGALFHQALTLTGKAQVECFKNASEKYAEVIRIKPDYHQAFFNLGNALFHQAKTLTGAAQAECFKNASEKYAEAIRIKPDDHQAFYNWGTALSDQALTLTGKAQVECFKKVGEKYAEAIRIKPDDHNAFFNWGAALSHEANTVSGDARSQILGAALEKLKRAKKLDGRGNYNLACIHAQLGNDELALDELEACQSDETLPDKDHLDQDTDLDSLRDTPRFAALFDPKKLKPVR